MAAKVFTQSVRAVVAAFQSGTLVKFIHAPSRTASAPAPCSAAPSFSSRSARSCAAVRQPRHADRLAYPPGHGRRDDGAGRAAGAAAHRCQAGTGRAMSFLMVPATIGPILGPAAGRLHRHLPVTGAGSSTSTCRSALLGIFWRPGSSRRCAARRAASSTCTGFMLSPPSPWPAWCSASRWPAAAAAAGRHERCSAWARSGVGLLPSRAGHAAADPRLPPDAGADLRHLGDRRGLTRIAPARCRSCCP